jgi:hypothetical protein
MVPLLISGALTAYRISYVESGKAISPLGGTKMLASVSNCSIAPRNCSRKGVQTVACIPGKRSSARGAVSGRIERGIREELRTMK